MRILFMGTPDIAAASLQALLDAGHEVCAVFTRRDKPVGRKQILTAAGQTAGGGAWNPGLSALHFAGRFFG